jgi:hypothetical protein
MDPPAFAKCKVWPADRGKTIVALAYSNIGDLRAASANAGDLDVLVVDSDTGNVVSRLAQTGILSNSLTGIAIDTADYAVATGARAFGVRASYLDSGEQSGFDPGERRTTDTLNLYLPAGDALKVIMRDLILNETRVIEYNSTWEEAADGALCAAETLITRTLVISGATSRDYFDILLKEKAIGRARSLVKDSCDAIADTPVPSRTYPLRFDGDRYLIPGKELQYSVLPPAPE